MQVQRIPSGRVAVASRSRALTVAPKALFGRKKQATAVVEEEAPKKTEKKKLNAFSTVVTTLEGAVPRSQKDAELLYDAKYGKRGADGKMSREQYGALRRKIGGTAKDYFKEWVEEERVEDTYWKPEEAGGSVPYLPVLVGILLAVLGATVVVVQQTGST